MLCVGTVPGLQACEFNESSTKALYWPTRDAGERVNKRTEERD